MSAGAAEPDDPIICIRDLTIASRDRALLSAASLEVARGELVLLLGISGTGKSITLSLLAGLFTPGQGIEAVGEVSVAGHEVLRTRRTTGVPDVGIVFQDFALFDDVDAEGNVLFGIDHGTPRPGDRRQRARNALLEMGLPAHLLPARLSGGMKQRLALARALAFEPAVMLYDEPTSGLDPRMAERVAQRIRDVHDHHHMTTVVVTHDLPPFLPHADRVILIDPSTRGFRSLEPSAAKAALESLEVPTLSDDIRPEAPRSWRARSLGFLESAGDFAIAAVRTVLSLLPRFPNSRWGRHFLWRYLTLTTLGSALPFIAIAGGVSGFIVTFFLFGIIPFRGFTEPVLQEEFVGSLGYALYRVVVPGVVTLLFASRSGAAMATDVGNRVLTRQLDAMRAHGVAPHRYLLTSMTVACVVGLPLLFVVAYVVAHGAALAVYLGTHPAHGALAFDAHVDTLLKRDRFGWPGGTHFVIQKLILCALATAGVSYHAAQSARRSGSEVANAVTATIIRATLLVLLVHLVYAFFEF